MTFDEARSERITVRLPSWLLRRTEERAREERRSRADVVRLAVEEVLGRPELPEMRRRRR